VIRRAAVSVVAITLGVAFVTPTSAIAVEDGAVVDSIVSGVLDVLDVSADTGLISELASELTPDIFDPALVSEVSRALDADQDAAAVVALTFDTDGDGKISGTERAALNLVSRENWRALEAVLAAHNSDDDDESDDDESDDDESSSNGNSGSNSGNNSSNKKDDDDDDESSSNGNSGSNSGNNSSNKPDDDDENEDEDEDEEDD
jgi:hypothetical protein